MPSILDQLRSLHETATKAPWTDAEWALMVEGDDRTLTITIRNNLGALLAVVDAARAASTAADGDPLNDAINALRATLSALDVESGS